jgi:hypothetical protein
VGYSTAICTPMALAFGSAAGGPELKYMRKEGLKVNLRLPSLNPFPHSPSPWSRPRQLKDLQDKALQCQSVLRTKTDVSSSLRPSPLLASAAALRHAERSGVCQ